MANLVLTQRAASGYDDVRELRYHFPSTYLNQAQQGIGDYFIYYEPRREGGREAYVGWGRVTAIEKDPKSDRHHYIFVSDYQDFPSPVPFRDRHESSVFKKDGSVNKGQFGRSVRTIPTDEFGEIVRAGFARILADELEAALAPDGPAVFADESSGLGSRELVRTLTLRTVRDRAFAAQVRNAYGGRCAFTGLKVENGGGWLEMEAAHIQPVKDRGPDSIRNGLALSRTVHALFDRGFLSIDERCRVLVSKTHPLPEKLGALLLPQALVPTEAALRPHPEFLRFHQENVFKDRAA